MSYVPPHKRHSNEPVRPCPVPESVLRKFNSNLNSKSRQSSNYLDLKITYARVYIKRWLLVGSNGTENQISPSVKLTSVSSDSAELRPGIKPLALDVNADIGGKSRNVGATSVGAPWLSVADSVVDDLVMVFKRAKNGTEHRALEKEKLRLVARFGKVLFHGHPSFSLESLKDGPVAESTLRNAIRSFYTNVSSSYMENIKNAAILKMGFRFGKEKEIYYVHLSDKTSRSIIVCKCTMNEDKRLNIHNVSSIIRHFISDVSCQDQNIDVRLMIYSQKMLTDLPEDEICNIKELIDSAVVDPNVKGWLRWPLGKASSGGRYSVHRVWRTMNTTFVTPTLKLKVREADRFDFQTGTGEAAREVTLMLEGICSKLQEQEVERSTVSNMLKDDLKMIWDYFLSADPYLM